MDMGIIGRQMDVARVRQMPIHPKGFPTEAALLESIVHQCKGKRTAMLTGNYVVKEELNITPGDNRLLGEPMLLTVELCARVYRACGLASIQLPTIFIIPNDVVPGTFESNEEKREFKAHYQVPLEILEILSCGGLAAEPIHYYVRDFGLDGHDVTRQMKLVRELIRKGEHGPVVTFESSLHNRAARALGHKRFGHASGIMDTEDGKKIIVPTGIFDSFTRTLQLASVTVKLSHPNGAPFCSFLAANFLGELEQLGFEQAINTFVVEEYPCVDKGAAAYKHLYGGRMPIRNIYLDGSTVVVDSTILSP